MEYVFTMKMSVRDYECDLQGIVNNANYLHYIEHTRHEFLKHAGANFAELHQNAIAQRRHLRIVPQPHQRGYSLHFLSRHLQCHYPPIVL